MTPSNVSATHLLPLSTIESLQSLPECQSVLNILHGTSFDGTNNSNANNDNPVPQLQPALDNLHRSRDILHSIPELEAATYLIEVELLTLYGKFDAAIECLSRYEYLCKRTMKKQMKTTKSGKKGGHRKEAMEDIVNQRKLQFVKAKLLYISGQFSRALAEYEDVLECMEQEVEDQVQQLQLRHGHVENGVDTEGNGEEKKRSELVQADDSVNPLPVIHGAAALSAVGITKLLIHLRKQPNGLNPSPQYSTKIEIDDIIEAMENATDMLLESRKDALLSHEHANLAIDLGLAASIAVTNLGVAHCLLRDDTNKAMELWKAGLTTLDEILQDAMNSLTVIPKHTFICMESVRARLYCNIAWVLLGNLSIERGGGLFIGPGTKPDEKALKDASEAAKKALHIYDELVNGPKVTRDGGLIDGDSDDDQGGNDEIGMRAVEEENDDNNIRQELEQMLREDETRQQKEEDEEEEDEDGPSKVNRPPDEPISPLWLAQHKSESAWALGLAAQCYALAGGAVTAEGLFRSAMDVSTSYPLGQSLKSKDVMSGKEFVRMGVSLSSPNLGLIARDVRVWYAHLCDMEEKRKADGDRLRSDAWKIEDDGVLRGFVRDEVGVKQFVSGLESSLWLFNPSDFER